MIKLSVGELLTEEIDEINALGHHIYVVRDGDVVFYVGKASNPIIRLLSHLGKGNWGWTGTSVVGNLIRDNLPASENWQVEIFTPSECGIEKGKIEETPTIVYYTDSAISEAERQSIIKYKPCLNTIDNPQPTPLPKRYRESVVDDPWGDEVAKILLSISKN